MTKEMTCKHGPGVWIESMHGIGYRMACKGVGGSGGKGMIAFTLGQGHRAPQQESPASSPTHAVPGAREQP